MTKDNPGADEREVLTRDELMVMAERLAGGPPHPVEVEFLQCLLDRYGESGKLVDLHDWRGFMRIVRKHAPAIAAIKETTSDQG